MTEVVDWPRDLCPQNEVVSVKAAAIQGVYTLGGVRQSSAVIGGRMMYRADFPAFGGHEKLRLATWMASTLTGGTIVRVPIRNRSQVPTLESVGLGDLAQYERTGIPFDDGSLFDDGIGFEVDIIATVATDVLAGSVEMTLIDPGFGNAIAHGHVFSVNGRINKIASVTAEAGLITIRSFVPFVSAPRAGDIVSFRPYFIGQCANAEAFLALIEAGRVIRPGSIELIEVRL